jgi:hypothetical protein
MGRERLCTLGSRLGATGFVATTVNDSELVTTLPIATRPWRRPRVAMSLTPADLPTLHAGDLIKASAELMVSTTCVDPGPRCIPSRTGPADTTPLGSWPTARSRWFDTPLTDRPLLAPI